MRPAKYICNLKCNLRQAAGHWSAYHSSSSRARFHFFENPNYTFFWSGISENVKSFSLKFQNHDFALKQLSIYTHSTVLLIKIYMDLVIA